MPKSDQVKVNVKERVDDNICDLSLSELSEVPVRDIAVWKRVTVLDLSSNRLITLGKNFSLLTRLVKLDLSKNQIKCLPEDFGLLQNLRHLDLYDNKIEHLPLSFGNLNSLRYLDLKGNPLMPALLKVVGHCLTTKDCQTSARETVKFLSQMQMEAKKEQAKYEMDNKNETVEEGTAAVGDKDDSVQKSSTRKQSKRLRFKNRRAVNQANAAANSNTQQGKSVVNNTSTKSTKRSSRSGSRARRRLQYGDALSTILLFLFLLGINIFAIYIITFKNPEIAHKVVEMIPPQYRDWIVTKTKFLRLCVSDWINEFRTPPEEN